MKANCDICNVEIDVEMCCDGYMCGCMGMPTYPPVCSKECDDKYTFKIHGIVVVGEYKTSGGFCALPSIYGDISVDIVEYLKLTK